MMDLLVVFVVVAVVDVVDVSAVDGFVVVFVDGSCIHRRQVDGNDGVMPKRKVLVTMPALVLLREQDSFRMT